MWPNKGKRNRPACPDGIKLIYREKGSWFDINVMKKTIYAILEPISKKMSQNKRGLLMIDNCRAHYDSKTKEIK